MQFQQVEGVDEETELVEESEVVKNPIMEKFSLSSSENENEDNEKEKISFQLFNENND
ncbi:hypothetical protein Glove_246g34 [Diversispora epigaea]|uniref:Uncharacterized protein n=1 Tax=Diversispora epigaea TaxID=1348612 RepID=A0A397IHD9_9GLOM|nr:hypothetical protein Glove_246g34 [Diversispora epigaea]